MYYKPLLCSISFGKFWEFFGWVLAESFAKKVKITGFPNISPLTMRASHLNGLNHSLNVFSGQVGIMVLQEILRYFFSGISFSRKFCRKAEISCVLVLLPPWIPGNSLDVVFILCAKLTRLVKNAVNQKIPRVFLAIVGRESSSKLIFILNYSDFV